jgi:hypothetical protein
MQWICTFGVSGMRSRLQWHFNRSIVALEIYVMDCIQICDRVDERLHGDGFSSEVRNNTTKSIWSLEHNFRGFLSLRVH